MFKDYYKILDINEYSTQEEIKSAFKKQALKWHPDRNIGLDTTIQMQEINEAYLILKDLEARARYDQEYQKFKIFQKQRMENQAESRKQKYHEYQYQKGHVSEEWSYQYSDYTVDDDILNRWMNNAKKQAVDLAKQTIEDIIGMVSVGTKAVVKEAGNQIVLQIIVSVIFIVIFSIIAKCN